MNEQKISIISKELVGLKSYEWGKIKQQIDMLFAHKAAKVELDDLEQIENSLKIEFNLQRFVDK